MPKKPKMLTREAARELALAHLQMDPPPADGHAPLPEDYTGPVLRLRVWEGTWRAQLWLSAEEMEGEEGRSAPDRYLVVAADGQVAEEAPTPNARRKRTTGRPPGRPRELPEDLDRRPRVQFTPDEDIHTEILRLAERHDLPVASVVNQLLDRALRGTKPSWEP